LVGWQLVVEEPIAAGGLNTQTIALRTTQLDLKYFAGARWTERSTRLVQTLMVESFENSGKIMAVGRQVIGLRSDLNVKSELREFQAEYFDGVDKAPNIRVRLNVKLIRQPRREIVASRTFETLVPSTGTSMRSIVEAFDEAVGKVLKNVVTWTLTEGDVALSNR
jgi:cholesterol transport system auxiliary component